MEHKRPGDVIRKYIKLSSELLDRKKCYNASTGALKLRIFQELKRKRVFLYILFILKRETVRWFGFKINKGMKLYLDYH
jgi:hypothetical protein